MIPYYLDFPRRLNNQYSSSDEQFHPDQRKLDKASQDRIKEQTEQIEAKERKHKVKEPQLVHLLQQPQQSDIVNLISSKSFQP